MTLENPSQARVDVSSGGGGGGGSTTEAVHVRPSPVSRWCELALEQFFGDFADQSMDLQIKIAENVLIHESKALIYCKMPGRVKQHWIKKLDDAFRESP